MTTFAKCLWLFDDSTVLQMHREACAFLVNGAERDQEPQASAMRDALAFELDTRGLLVADRVNA